MAAKNTLPELNDGFRQWPDAVDEVVAQIVRAASPRTGGCSRRTSPAELGYQPPPSDAYGQVILESDAGTTAPDLPRPPRVALTVLAREITDRLGVRVSEAVVAWAEEWVVDEPDPTRDVAVRVGASVRWAATCMPGQLERL